MSIAAIIAVNIAAAVILVSILTAVMLTPLRLPEPQPLTADRDSRRRQGRSEPEKAWGGRNESRPRPAMRPIQDF
ncbi:MAG TPA: hypothetical protein VGF04_05515 [Solirubrobacterales bacterium]|jgi:hypothetical protein